jgi:hypothetical protein
MDGKEVGFTVRLFREGETYVAHVPELDISSCFSLARQEGDHKIFTKAGVLRPLVIPTYRAVPVFIIRNLLRTSGMSRERYFELMEG